MQETQVRFLGWEDPLEKEMYPTPVSLPGNYHLHRNLMGCSLWGRRESGTTEWLTLFPEGAPPSSGPLQVFTLSKWGLPCYPSTSLSKDPLNPPQAPGPLLHLQRGDFCGIHSSHHESVSSGPQPTRRAHVPTQSLAAGTDIAAPLSAAPRASLTSRDLQSRQVPQPLFQWGVSGYRRQPFYFVPRMNDTVHPCAPDSQKPCCQGFPLPLPKPFTQVNQLQLSVWSIHRELSHTGGHLRMPPRGRPSGHRLLMLPFLLHHGPHCQPGTLGSHNAHGRRRSWLPCQRSGVLRAVHLVPQCTQTLLQWVSATRAAVQHHRGHHAHPPSGRSGKSTSECQWESSF